MISSQVPEIAVSRAIALVRACVGALLASTGTFVLARWALAELHRGSVPWLADRVMRSRDEYSFAVYWSDILRVPTAVLAVTVGTAVLVILAWKHRPVLTEPGLQTIQRRIQGRLLPLSVLVWLSIAAGVRASGLMAFATNDDGMMMLAVSGAYGSNPSPATGFIHVLLGRVLVALYASSTVLPWYGLMMLGGQIIGLAVITWLLAESLVRSPAAETAVALLAVLMVGSYLTLAVQFTQVAITLSAAGFAVLLRPEPRRRSSFESVAPSRMIQRATMIRAESVVLTALMVAGILVPLLVTGRAAPRRVGVLVALLVVVGAMWLDVVDDGRFEPTGALDWRADLLPPERKGDWIQPVYWETLLAARYAPVSLNDRALVQRWLYPSDDVFGPATSENSTSFLNNSADGSASWMFNANSVRHRMVDTLAFSALLLLVGSAGHRTLRERAAGFVAALVPTVGILLLAGFARAPNRVAVATLLMGTALISLIHTAPTAQSLREDGLSASTLDSPPLSVLLRTTMSMAVLFALAATSLGLASLHETKVISARTFQSEARALIESTQGLDVVVVWLSPFLDGLDPLVTPQEFQELSIVEVAGWHSVMPFHRERLADLEATDWISSLQTSSRVVLLSESETTALIGTFLSERRGLRCPQPVILGSGELIEAVERFESGDCD